MDQVLVITLNSGRYIVVCVCRGNRSQFYLILPKSEIKRYSVWYWSYDYIRWFLGSIRGLSGRYSSILNWWPRCNLAASHRRPYCTSMNSHSLVGLVSRQWDAVDWTYVLWELRIYNDQARRSATSRHCACPLYSCRAGFLAKHHITHVCQPPTAQIWQPATYGFSQS